MDIGPTQEHGKQLQESHNLAVSQTIASQRIYNPSWEIFLFLF